MESKNISQAVISRLPRYYRYLGDLLAEGQERISSNALSARMHVTASQIRQDLNQFGGFGQQGYGYNIESLRREIGKLLGLEKPNNFIIIGAGNLGTAIANYAAFEKYGFELKGIFDIDLSIEDDKIRGVSIQHIRELKDFLHNNQITIAALTVPRKAVDEILQVLISARIKGIWNFTHVELDVPKTIQVENVHLSDSLLRLSSNIYHADR